MGVWRVTQAIRVMASHMSAHAALTGHFSQRHARTICGSVVHNGEGSRFWEGYALKLGQDLVLEEAWRACEIQVK